MKTVCHLPTTPNEPHQPLSQSFAAPSGLLIILTAVPEPIPSMSLPAEAPGAGEELLPPPCLSELPPAMHLPAHPSGTAWVCWHHAAVWFVSPTATLVGSGLCWSSWDPPTLPCTPRLVPPQGEDVCSATSQVVHAGIAQDPAQARALQHTTRCAQDWTMSHG